ncbi:hypothetical protein Tco_1075807, partial [Tanacetum coccineum]
CDVLRQGTRPDKTNQTKQDNNAVIEHHMAWSGLDLKMAELNIPKQIDSLKTKDSNKPLLTSTGVKPTTSASGSRPSSNIKNNRITLSPSSNQKNKVQDHSRKVKSSLNKMNSGSEPVSNALVKHSMRNAKFESICTMCNKCLFDANHDMCIIDYVNDVNVRRTFTIVRNRCPLTRITSTKVVPTKETSTKSIAKPTQGILVYSRRPKATRSVGSSSKVKIVESKTSNSKEPKQSWGSTISDVLSSSLSDCRFGNDHIAKIMGYGDYQMGNVTISRVYYMEGLGMDQDSAHMVAASKVPMLKPENGATLPKTTTIEGVVTVMPITTAEEKA